MPNLESYFNYFFLTMKAIYADLKKKKRPIYRRAFGKIKSANPTSQRQILFIFWYIAFQVLFQGCAYLCIVFFYSNYTDYPVTLHALYNL